MADALAILGVLVIAGSLWAIWPPIAGLWVGAVLLVTALRLARVERPSRPSREGDAG